MLLIRQMWELLSSARLRPFEAIGLMGLGGTTWGMAVEGTAPSWAPAWIGWPVATIGIAMLTVGAFLLALEIKTRWPQGLYRQTIRRTSAAGQSRTAVRHEPGQGEFRFDAPQDADLAIFMEREEFHPFQHTANLLEAKFRVENKTAKPKYLMGTTWEMDPSQDGPTGNHHSVDVQRAVYALKEKRPPELHGIVAPGDTISGWVHVSLPWQPWGGIGGYTVKIEDEVGTQYVLRRERRGGHKPPP